MSGAIVDLVIVVFVVVMAAFGYRNGLLKAGSSLLGMLIGLAIAVPLVSLIGGLIHSRAWRLGLAVGLLVFISNLGYIGGMQVGEALRRRVRRPSSMGIDRAAGGVITTIVTVIVVWMLAVPLAKSPIPGVSKAMRASVILPGIDAVMPDQARSLYNLIDKAIADQGLPDVVGPLDETNVADVGTPDPAVIKDSEVQRASKSVVKVIGDASKCDRIVDGSGFVYAPDRVVTNAHVVAGTSSLTIEANGHKHDATVVYADENLDIAVLKVNDLGLPVLEMVTSKQDPGTDLVVAGYPGGGPKVLEPAKARTEQDVTGPSFRGDATVTRSVLVLRGHVIPGNSGGPVLDLDGHVVGLVFGAAADKDDVGYALTVPAIGSALEQAKNENEKVVTGACYP